MSYRWLAPCYGVDIIGALVVLLDVGDVILRAVTCGESASMWRCRVANLSRLFFPSFFRCLCRSPILARLRWCQASVL